MRVVFCLVNRLITDLADDILFVVLLVPSGDYYYIIKSVPCEMAVMLIF